MSLANGLSILFILSKNQLLALLIFFMVFLFVFFFWDSYNSNVGVFHIVLEVSEIVLISFNSFFLFPLWFIYFYNLLLLFKKKDFFFFLRQTPYIVFGWLLVFVGVYLFFGFLNNSCGFFFSFFLFPSASFL